MAEISIRAPARGATIRGDINADDRLYFNPRSREGSDEHCRQASGHQFISIRAPARGATAVDLHHLSAESFQSALPRGERLLCFLQFRDALFISIRAPARGATSARI